MARDLPPLAGDAHQIQQMLLNLVSNAHHALSDAPPPKRISISTRHDAEAGRIVLIVADSGPGIAPATRARIFDPFFTTKPPGKGPGLGLSLCRGIVESHEGTIEAESPSAGGALFRIVLPIGSPPREPSDDAAALAVSRRPARERRILVVDDEPAVAELIAEFLSDEGHEVDIAEHGKAALLKMETTRYDVVLSDLRMPELDGPGLYRAVTERFPELTERFIFVTGDSLTPEARHFLDRSTAPHVSKPLSIDELHQAVQKIIDAHARTSADPES